MLINSKTVVEKTGFQIPTIYGYMKRIHMDGEPVFPAIASGKKGGCNGGVFWNEAEVEKGMVRIAEIKAHNERKRVQTIKEKKKQRDQDNAKKTTGGFDLAMSLMMGKQC